MRPGCYNSQSMTSLDYQHVLDVATAAARETGALLRDGFSREKTISTKSSAVDWVTEYDTAAEKLLAERLQTAFPNHTFIGEEGTAAAGDEPYTWYIDPLDGTTNFAHGFPFFCVSLAMWSDDRPQLGVIYSPMLDELFTAVAGQGAFLTSGNETRQLRVSVETDLRRCLLATGYPYDVHTSDDDNLAQTELFTKRAQGLRRAGSAALDVAYVAAGRFDGYWEWKVFNWDVAASMLMVQEAGGVVTFFDGHPVMPLPRQFNLVASNGRIHQPMLDIIARTLEAT